MASPSDRRRHEVVEADGAHARRRCVGVFILTSATASLPPRFRVVVLVPLELGDRGGRGRDAPENSTIDSRLWFFSVAQEAFMQQRQQQTPELSVIIITCCGLMSFYSAASTCCWAAAAGSGVRRGSVNMFSISQARGGWYRGAISLAMTTTTENSGTFLRTPGAAARESSPVGPCPA